MPLGGGKSQYLIDIQVYIDIYVRVSLGGHNLGTFYASYSKFGTLLTQI